MQGPTCAIGKTSVHFLKEAGKGSMNVVYITLVAHIYVTGFAKRGPVRAIINI